MKNEIEKRLKKVYEDDDVIVEYNLSYNELKELVYDILKKQGPMTSYSLQKLLTPYVSDDMARRMLRELEGEGKVIYDYSLKKYRVKE